MTEVELDITTHKIIDLPEYITVNNEKVKGEYYDDYDDTSYDGPVINKYWQYQGEDWIIWINIETDSKDSVEVRATAGDEDFWALDKYVKLNVLKSTIRKAVKEMNDYYKNWTYEDEE